MQKLHYPIKFYWRKPLMIFVTIMCFICAIGFFMEIFFDYFPQNSRGELPKFMQFIMMLSMLLVGCFTLIPSLNNLANIIVESDKISLLNPIKREYQVINFRDVKAINFHLDTKHPVMTIIFKHKLTFNMKYKEYPLHNFRVEKYALNSRQVADIIQQAWQNFQFNAENPQQHIELRDIKQKFFDWY
ncbi:hypothetical protein [Acinetobacter sp. c1-l78]|uniref:hypothetical protein n=1 Tax=Acinetobacter sp. c1-l78 TaxID=3342803 RepID=UPI0035B9206A